MFNPFQFLISLVCVELKKPLPGPGEYQVVEQAGIRADGKYPIAKLRYGGTLKFGTGERDNYMIPSKLLAIHINQDRRPLVQAHTTSEGSQQLIQKEDAL